MTAVAQIGRVVTFLPKVVLGILGGSLAGVAGRGSQVEPLIPAGTGTINAIRAGSVYSPIRDVVANEFWAKGLAEISKSGIGGAYRSILSQGFVKGFQNVFSTLAGGALGIRGFAILGIAGFAAISAIQAGSRLFMDGWTVYDRLKKDELPGDKVRKPWYHLSRMFVGAALFGGGILTIIPGAAAFGLPLMATAFVASIGLNLLGYMMGGVHMFNYPDIAPWPLNNILKVFHPFRVG